MVKNSPANAGDVREVVQSLGQEEPQEERTPHFSILATGISWTEEPS